MPIFYQQWKITMFTLTTPKYINNLTFVQLIGMLGKILLPHWSYTISSISLHEKIEEWKKSVL